MPLLLQGENRLRLTALQAAGSGGADRAAKKSAPLRVLVGELSGIPVSHGRKATGEQAFAVRSVETPGSLHLAGVVSYRLQFGYANGNR